MAKLASTLPKGSSNGLGVIGGALVNNPHQTHVVLAVVDCKKVTTDMDSGEVEPTARIRRIEVVNPDDYQRAEQMLRRALERRLNLSTLPIEIEDEITELFKLVDVSDLDAMPDGEE